MLAIFVGAAVALIVFGLPLAIIALFVASILDRRNKGTVESARTLSSSVRGLFTARRIQAKRAQRLSG